MRTRYYVASSWGVEPDRLTLVNVSGRDGYAGFKEYQEAAEAAATWTVNAQAERNVDLKYHVVCIVSTVDPVIKSKRTVETRVRIRER